MSDTAIGLVPLGIIHTDHYDDCREPLMRCVETEWRVGKLTLWGYPRGKHRCGSKPIPPYPCTLELELDWVAGPGRDDNGNPRFPELEYYCDVSAYHRDNPSDFWSELLIARADLDRLRTTLPEAALLAYREWRNMAAGCAPFRSTDLAPDGRSFPPSRLKPFWSQAEAVALRWLEENGCPQPGDGNQAILETVVADWLAERGHEASESTIRRHVRRCMKRYRESL
jgi:hypothetical protein